MRLLCLLGLSLALLSCSASKPASSSSAPSAVLPADPYLAALQLQAQGQDSLADLMLLRASSTDTASAYLAGEAARIWAERENIDSVRSSALRCLRLSNAKDPQCARFVGTSYRLQSRMDSAAVYLELASRLSPEPNPQIFQELLAVYQSLRKPLSLLSAHGRLVKAAGYREDMLRKHLAMADELNQPESALVVLRGAWEQSRDPEMGRTLAQWVGMSGKWSESIDILQELLKTAPDTSKASLTEALAFAYSRGGRRAEASELYATMAKSSGDAVQYYRMAAAEALAGGLNERARAMADKALAAEGQPTGKGLLLLSVAQSAQGKYDSALATLHRARALDASMRSFVAEESRWMARSGRFTQATSLLDSLVKTYPDSSELRLSRAQILYERFTVLDSMGKPDVLLLRRADRDLAVLMLADPTATDILVLRGTVQAAARDGLAAAGFFRLALAVDSLNASAMNALGYTLLDLGVDTALGGRWIDKALHLNPSSLAALDSKAWYMHKVGRSADALQILLGIVANKDDDVLKHWEVWYHLAVVHAALGHKKDALEALATARRYGAERPEYAPLRKTISRLK